MRILPIAILSFVMCLPGGAAINQPVKVTGGRVSGVPGKDASILVFKGIPYAAPPVGNLRWRAPQPVVAWQDVRKADHFSASCMQSIVEQNPPWTYEFMTHTEISEDCLYMNVWTPAKSAGAKLPVFVYIYGGAFTGGSGAVPTYDGEGLAKKGLVVVNFNYRVGIPGYLAHPELSKEADYHASGNYGELDQIAAFAWVRANIAAFGGDPARVTIAGQSAGSMSIHALLASPLAKGLFRGAIMESGGNGIGGASGGPASNVRTLADAEAAGTRFAASKGAHSIAELRAMTWQQLTGPAAGGGRGASVPAGPIIDGYFLPLPEMQAIAERKHIDVPVIAGCNLGELGPGGGMGGGGGRGAAAPTLEAYQAQSRQQYGDLAEEFLKLYPAASEQDVAAARAQAMRDRGLSAVYLWAKQRNKTSRTKVFLYLFDHTLPGPNSERLGAFHSAELPYVLNVLDMSDRPFTDADHKVAAMLSSYWANFVKKGDPNGPGLPIWPAVGDKPEVMELGDKNEPVPAAGTAERSAFWEKALVK